MQKLHLQSHSHHRLTVDIVVPYKNHTDVQHIARTVQVAAELIILNRFKGARAERYQKMVTECSAVYNTHQNLEEAEMATKNVDVVMFKILISMV